MNMKSDAMIGVSLIPQGVKFRAKPTNGTVAKLRPRLKADLSTPPKFFFPGNKAHINA